MAAVYALVAVVLLAPTRPADGYLGVAIRHDDGKVVVMEVLKDSPAEKAGLKEDDVILKLGDKDVTEVEKFVEMVRALKPGDEITLTVKRGKDEKKIKAKVGERPGDGS
jgi:serine protease Do